MITLKEYEAEDWIKIDDPVEPFMPCRTFKEFDEIVQQGVSVTAIENGNVMACGGVALRTDDTGIVWVKVSKKCFAKHIKYVRGMIEVFKIMMESLGHMTVTAYIVDNFCKGERLAKMIGMKRIGIPIEFNGNKYNLYSVVT